MIVAVIPARGGSKRIPRKNIRLFAGKPIIAYPITAARDCGLFTRIIVTTDDEEIASVARAFGAETPFAVQQSSRMITRAPTRSRPTPWNGLPDAACRPAWRAVFIRPRRS